MIGKEMRTGVRGRPEEGPGALLQQLPWRRTPQLLQRKEDWKRQAVAGRAAASAREDLTELEVGGNQFH